MAEIKIQPLEQSEIIYVDGSYVANIQAIEQGRSRSDLDMLTVTLKGDFGASSPHTIRGYCMDTEQGRKLLYKLYKALGLEKEESVDTDDLQGKYVGIVIKEGKPYNDKRSWSVVDYYMLDEDDSDDDVDVDTDDWSDAE
mgnify:CR=1 FL=1